MHTRRTVVSGLLAGVAIPRAVEADTPVTMSPGFRKALENPDISVGEGRDIRVTFDTDTCIHARFCVAWLPNVFRPGQDPWMDVNAASADEVAAIVRNCPSGALQYQRLDGAPQEDIPAANTVQVRESGPLAFRGNLVIDGEDIGNRATLCRCGQSRNMPYCDSSHVDAGFDATGEPDSILDENFGRFREYLADPDKALEIAVIEDGPYDVTGGLQILSGTGRRIDTPQAVQLCRCGKSGSKPFCDGSHST